MGTNASQTIQVEYIVNAMYLASLKFSGMPPWGSLAENGTSSRKPEVLRDVAGFERVDGAQRDEQHVVQQRHHYLHVGDA